MSSWTTCWVGVGFCRARCADSSHNQSVFTPGSLAGNLILSFCLPPSSVSSHTHTEFRIPFLSCKMSNCSLSRSRAPLFQPGCLISGHFHSSAAQISNTPTTLSIFMWLHRPKSVHSQGRIWSSYLRFVPSSPQPHVSLLKITKHPSCLETDLCVFSSLMASSGKTHSLFVSEGLTAKPDLLD